MLEEIESLIANNPILQTEPQNTKPSKRIKSIPLSKMKSPKSTSSQKTKGERKTKAKRDIQPMKPLVEEEESHDEPLRSQRLAAKRAAKESLEVEATPTKKNKKEVPAKSPPKESKKAERVPEKGISIKEGQQTKAKKDEVPKGKGKGKLYPEEPEKEQPKKAKKLFVEDDAKDLLLVPRPKKKGRERSPIKFYSLSIKPEREVVFTSLKTDVNITFEKELKEIGLLDFIQVHIKGKYNSKLVKEFYSNAKVFYHKEEEQLMVLSSVKGKPIAVKTNILEELFQLPEEGIEYKDCEEYTLEEYLHNQHKDLYHKGTGILDFPNRILHGIVTGTLRPIRNGISIIDYEDLFFMGAIQKKKEVRLSTFILNDLRRVIHGEIKSLHWPILITKLILKHGIKEEALEGGKSLFDAGNIRRTEWTDVGTPGVWRRKKTKQAPLPIPSLSEPPAAPSAPTDSELPQAPIAQPSSSQATSTKPQAPATLDEIREQLVDLQSTVFEGFTNVHKVLTQQHQRLTTMEEHIQGLKFTLGFSDIDVDILLRQQQRAKAEARRKQEEELQQREEEIQGAAEEAQEEPAAESPHITFQELNQQALEREQQEEQAAKEEEEKQEEETEERIEDSEESEKEEGEKKEEEDDEEEDSEEEQSSESNGSSSPDEGQFEVKERTTQSSSGKSEEF